MIMPSDNEYKETKLIMQDKAVLKPEFKPLAYWIDHTYNVRTVNIIYDIIEPSKTPRLQICFELRSDKLKFSDPTTIFPDSQKQVLIVQKFKELIRPTDLLKTSLLKLFNKTQYKTNGLFVVFSAFEPIARQEANGNISRDKIVELKNAINDKNLWEISKAFEGVTFFLYTNEQVKLYENSNIKEQWSDYYFEILKNLMSLTTTIGKVSQFTWIVKKTSTVNMTVIGITITSKFCCQHPV